MTLYATVEDVRAATGSKSTATDVLRIIAALEAASRDVDDVVQRTDGAFRPLYGTYYYDWPVRSGALYYRLWLDAQPLIGLTGLTAGAASIPLADVFLEPQRYGPPYDRIEIDIGSSSAFGFDKTPQRAIGVTGLWGYGDDRRSAGTLVGPISDSASTLVVSDGSLSGTGDHLVIGTERMEITSRMWSDSLQDLGSGLASSAAAVAVAVADGTGFHSGELILIDAERMAVVDVAGNNLIVRRAHDGSTMAAHLTGASVYVQRVAVVTRGARGSVATSHPDGATIEAHVVPGDVRELTVASAVTSLLSGQAGWAREYGPQGATTKLGQGLDQLRGQVQANYGRQCRTRVV